jgi:hypothetical protein
LASCTPDQKSRETIKGSKDDTPHGAFTYHLLKALDGAASDEQGFISLATLHEYLAKQFRGKNEQTPRFLLEGSNLGDIRIAVATEKYQQNISARIKRAQDHLAQKEFVSLLQATKEVFEVIRINSKHREAMELRDKVAGTLDQQKRQMMHWLMNCGSTVGLAVPYVYKEFDRLVDQLSFDGVATLSERQSNLLILLNRGVSEEIDRDKFIERCGAFNDPESRPRRLADAVSRPAD